MISRFFINRPIFAAVLAIFIVIVGGISMSMLPISQYPQITPPTVTVTGMYPGADATTIAQSVGAPLEEAINGVEGMIYMSSTSNNDGIYSLTITFEVGTDVNIATVLVENKVSQALPQLPSIVQKLGVTTQKKSTNMVILGSIYAKDGAHLDSTFLANYADAYIADELRRIEGVGDVTIFGVGDYSIRVWLNPDALEDHGMSPSDVVTAIQNQNQETSAGHIGQSPGLQKQVSTYAINVYPGRLKDVADFENIIVNTTPEGGTVYLKDVAEINLGSEKYTMSFKSKGKLAGGIGVYQLPNSNALDVSNAVRAKLDELKESFPEGMDYHITIDTTDYVTASIKEVIETLLIAVFLVFVVMYMFLQSWRATIIPSVTIPVALIGAFAAMAAFGFSINILTLFGIVLAIGIVVDDAIVVVENTSRYLEEGLSPKEAAIKAMQEVTGPIVATTLVLMSVFIPAAMMSGITGELYKQFALTIAFSTLFSALNALTLTPALCSLILRKEVPSKFFIFVYFNKGYDYITNKYHKGVAFTLRKMFIFIFLYLLISGLSFVGYSILPATFIPNEDQGYMLVSAQLPDASTLSRTNEVATKLDSLFGTVDGVDDWISINGYSIIDGATASNQLTIFIRFEDWDTRLKKGRNLLVILNEINKKAYEIDEAVIFSFVPPAINGLGASGGIQLVLQDKQGDQFDRLQKFTEKFSSKIKSSKIFKGANATFRANIPNVTLFVDAQKAMMYDIPLNEIYTALNSVTGSQYVNDFSKWGRTFQVNVQGEKEYRKVLADVYKIKIKNAKGQLVSLDNIVSSNYSFSPQIVTRYNMFNASNIIAQVGPMYSSGAGIKELNKWVKEDLDITMDAEWTGMAYQEIKAGSNTIFIFGMAILLVYLVLAAQYESWLDPFAVILAVPMAIFGAVLFVAYKGQLNSIYMQIGVVLLVALSSKNAILIVEFARENLTKGLALKEAIINAAVLRFRPILMTSFAFILGVYPLVIATGAGANSRHALGATVFGGMLSSTLLSIFFTPVIYYGLHRLSQLFKK
ncbi:efflux RND transporter permease subunit [Flammeovirga kamogawensis]|uniref:Efflux RND transporter permease subunit n=1 Tax=Flammeovirga kamogawensis TaxID=373891 RepID=A0ABX8H1I8_9BACT|nr:multidrug efflux RND transporter permease subunit [Flammeovirga kamogawensis]MBB6463964.1 HAE1 family hydrophobic/amphiphilic exporter-1 [Flammeovirga kamogawensis]QWG09759.1 efflux RND transporter permease subunit [Flammeovirga kamogawensis]TRX65270.1 efflux RND transporter permease subunit [Flammeovirga kamogawensis]